MTQRVLLVHRYFWPDVPTYAQMLRFIGGRLAREGHDVTVFCGQPTYNNVYAGPPRPRRERVDGVRVHRVELPPDSKQRPALRAVSLLVFAIRLVLHVVARRKNYDLITVTTIPPVLMGMAARVIRRLVGIPYVYHCMDLYPEVAEISGMASNPALIRLAKRLDTATCRRAAAVVVLSNDMRDTLLRRGVPASKIVVLNNFEVLEPDASTDGTDLLPVDDTRFRVVFAGNMGRFQGLGDLMSAALLVAEKYEHVEFDFIGSGVAVPELKRQAGVLLDKQVRFFDHQPVATAALALEHAQLAVVSLRPGIYQVAYPSKTATCLAAGCRILAVVEEQSDLAQLVRTEAVGTVCPPGDVTRLASAISGEVDKGALTADAKRTSRETGERYFGRELKLDEWTRLVTQIGERVA